MRLKKLWLNLSVQKKLFSVVGIMAVLVAFELFTLYFAMSTLSAVRAFVGSEGLWSKGHKNAVIALNQYVIAKNPADYITFKNELEVSLGDKVARLELMKDDFNPEVVREGFLRGKNHDSDIPSMITLVRRFGDSPLMAKTVQAWAGGDDLVEELIQLGEKIDSELQSGIDQKRQNYFILEIGRIDSELTRLENEFSYTLGWASRFLENMLMFTLLLIVITVESTGLYFTYRFGLHLRNTLRELNNTAIKVGEGDFTQKLQVDSTDELGQLAESLNKMVERLESQTIERQHAEQASQAKNLFLANMSHEIRTPLNAILGFAEILQDQHLEENDKKRYAAIIRRTGESLNTIINDILDVAKIEADRIETQEAAFSLPQMLSDLYALLKMRCDEKGIQLIFERIGTVSDFIVSDQTRLRQILINMIGNSIKFTEKGHVMLTYEVRESMLFFTVSDTGAGISQKQRSNLFKVFSQGDSSVKKKYGGTGLGLSIAHKNILVVEDSLDNQLLLEFYLTKHKANVVFANNGKEGVDAALKGKYDLILMDIQMPVLDGYAATEELRLRGVTIPIIALTGYAMKEDQEKCLKAGCNEFLAKPIHKEKLLSTLSKYFRHDKPEQRPLDFI